MNAIDALILEVERTIDSNDARNAESVLARACGAIADEVPTYKHGLKRYRARVNGKHAYAMADVFDDLQVVLGKMKMLRDKNEREIEVEKLRAAQRGATVVIRDVGNSHSESSASVDFSASLSQVVEQLGSCGLDDEELKEIKSAILDLSSTDKSNPTDVCDKALKVLNLVKGAADAAKAVSPFVGGVLSTVS